MTFLTPGDKTMFAFSKARECRHRAEEHRTKADNIRAIVKMKLEMPYYKANPDFAEFMQTELNHLARIADQSADYLDQAADYFEDYGNSVTTGVK